MEVPGCSVLRGERLVEVFPEVLDVLAADAEPEQGLGCCLAARACPALDKAFHAAQALAWVIIRTPAQTASASAALPMTSKASMAPKPLIC